MLRCQSGTNGDEGKLYRIADRHRSAIALKGPEGTKSESSPPIDAGMGVVLVVVGREGVPFVFLNCPFPIPFSAISQ